MRGKIRYWLAVCFCPRLISIPIHSPSVLQLQYSTQHCNDTRLFHCYSVACGNVLTNPSAMYEKQYPPTVVLKHDISPGGSSQMSGAHASSSSLSKFVAKRSLPSVVQVVAGCYGNISANKDNELYVHSTSQQTVVVAETLAGKTAMIGRSAARRMRTTTGQTLSLPLDYDGLHGLISALKYQYL